MNVVTQTLIVELYVQFSPHNFEDIASCSMYVIIEGDTFSTTRDQLSDFIDSIETI